MKTSKKNNFKLQKLKRFVKLENNHTLKKKSV
jgi:hypothetical protein